jgi:hypothetical protein
LDTVSTAILSSSLDVEILNILHKTTVNAPTIHNETDPLERGFDILPIPIIISHRKVQIYLEILS